MELALTVPNISCLDALGIGMGIYLQYQAVFSVPLNPLPQFRPPTLCIHVHSIFPTSPSTSTPLAFASTAASPSRRLPLLPPSLRRRAAPPRPSAALPLPPPVSHHFALPVRSSGRRRRPWGERGAMLPLPCPLPRRARAPPPASRTAPPLPLSAGEPLRR